MGVRGPDHDVNGHVCHIKHSQGIERLGRFIGAVHASEKDQQAPNLPCPRREPGPSGLKLGPQQRVPWSEERTRLLRQERSIARRLFSPEVLIEQ
ncbi:hypothetical protein D3C86_1897190 [compost metagenome]